MVNERYRNAYTEVLYYLKGIDKNYIEKIPKKLIYFLQRNANLGFECNFDYNLPLNELNLSNEALGLIGMICLNYWCNTEEEKDMIKRKFYENEKIYQKELKEKYNLDILLKNKRKTQESIKNNISEETAIIEYKEKNFIQKIFDKIKHFFKIN